VNSPEKVNPILSDASEAVYLWLSYSTTKKNPKKPHMRRSGMLKIFKRFSVPPSMLCSAFELIWQERSAQVSVS